MYEEVAPKPTGAFWNILLIVGGGFLLLSLPNVLPVLFAFPYVKAIYDFAVLLVLCLFVFRLICKYSTDYKYRLEESVLIVSGKIGAKETVYAEISMESAVYLRRLSEVDAAELKSYGRLHRISYGVSDKKSAYLLLYPMQKGHSALIFQPSDEFVKLLQQFTS